MPEYSDGTKIRQATEWNRLLESIPASYVIWRDTSTTPATIRAECNLSGGTDYSGLDAATVINNALAALTNGGTVFIKSGHYEITTTILIQNSGIHLDGECSGSMYNPVTGNGVWLYGDGDHCMIRIKRADAGRIENVMVTNLGIWGGQYTAYAANAFGIYVFNAGCVWIQNNDIYYCGDDGIRIEGTGEVQYISQNDCSLNWSDGIDIHVGFVHITENHAWGNAACGINIVGTVAEVINGNSLYVNLQNGILLYSTRDTVVSNNLVLGNDALNTGIHSGIVVTATASTNNVITGNVCRDNDHYEIRLDADATNTTVIGNNVNGDDHDAAIVDAGTNNEIHYNVGYKTENRGTSTGTGAEQTIAHGLVAQPNDVTVIPDVTGTTVSAVWADATNVYCTVTNLKAYHWSAKIV